MNKGSVATMVVGQGNGDRPARRQWRRYIRNALGCIAVIGVLLYFTPIGIPCHQSWYEWRNRGEFDRHRNSYEALVRAIQAMKFPVDRPEFFRIDPDKNVATLRPASQSDPGSLENLIVARRGPDGRLTVTICTYNLGHAGSYGLYYSSGPPSSGEVENSFGVDGRVAPVAAHWWRVSDYSQ